MIPLDDGILPQRFRVLFWAALDCGFVVLMTGRQLLILSDALAFVCALRYLCPKESQRYSRVVVGGLHSVRFFPVVVG